MKSDNTKEIVIDKDDGIRYNVTKEKLSKLKPSFKREGISTGGNSS